MRVTVSHNQSKQEMMKAVDKAVGDLFKGIPMGPVQISDPQKSWQGSTLTFTMTAKMGILKNPIRGTIEVTDKDLTIDADLGILNSFLPESKVKAAVETQVQKLLKA